MEVLYTWYDIGGDKDHFEIIFKKEEQKWSILEYKNKFETKVKIEYQIYNLIKTKQGQFRKQQIEFGIKRFQTQIEVIIFAYTGAPISP